MNNRFKLFLVVLKYTKNHIPYYLLGFAALLIIDYIEVLVPVQTAAVIDIIKTMPPSIEGIYPYLLRIFIFITVITIFRFVWRYTIFGTSRRIETELREKLYSHLSGLSNEFYTANKTGDLMAYFTNDLNAVRMTVGPGFLMVSDFIIITIFVLTRMILTTNFTLTLIACIPLPLIAFLSLVMTRKMHDLFERKQSAFGKLSDVTQEFISGIRVIKSFVQYKGALSIFNKTNLNNRNITDKMIRLEALVEALVQFSVGFSFLTTLIYGGYLTSKGDITLGVFFAFYEYLILLIWPAMALGWSINIITKGLSSVKRIEKLLAVKPLVIENDGDCDITEAAPITFSSLTFKYPEDHSSSFSLRNINLNIEKDKITAITGRTGSGKTTLVNILARIVNADKGQVFINGRDILDIKPSSIRENIALVTQELFLFSDTIKKNIALGYEEPDLDLIISASKTAGFHDNVLNFLDGYDTVIGERGVTLSGGQKQRLTIARAVIKESKVLILDDAMSAVDTDTEKRIMKNILKERKNRTTIIISHRISSIMNADKIVVMDDGEIKESGKHGELLKHNGLYKELYEKQKLEEALNV